MATFRWGFVLLFFVSVLSFVQSSESRYAPGIVSILDSHAYISKNKALIYWKISPYYISQQNDRACSLATATMIVNAARSSQILTANQLLATQNGLLSAVQDENWTKDVGINGTGETLDRLKSLLFKALEAYGLSDFTVEAIHLKNSEEESLALLRSALIEGEVTGKLFVVVNFDRKFFTDPMGGGHFAPVGSYDQQTKRVLIMDPDRESYEPYWVPEKLFMEGMATEDGNHKECRGYLLIKIK